MSAAVITAAQLQKFSPRCDFMAVAPALNRSALAHGIVTPRRVRHFMAHLHHESLGFIRLEENLNYSAKRLCQVWPRRFPTLASAQPYAGKPRALAEKVYGGRLGNSRPGDGWLRRGRGFMMITGEDNYRRAEKWSGLPLLANPDLAAQTGPAAEIAAAFWEAEGLNQIVDADDDERAIADVADKIRLNETDDLVEGTEEINGGRIGLDDRNRQLLRAAFIWTD